MTISSTIIRIDIVERHTARSARRFSLIELLVTIGILVILAALLLPVLQRAKSMAYTSTCMNNNKQIGIAWLMYADEFKQNLGACNPYSTGGANADTWYGTAPWYIALAGGKYLDAKVFGCPADKDQANHKTGPETTSDLTYLAINSFFSTSYTTDTIPQQIAQETLPNSYMSNYCLGWRNSGGVADATTRSSLNTIAQNTDPSRFWLISDGGRQSEAAGLSVNGIGYWYGYAGFAMDEGVWQDATRHSTGRIFLLADGHAERLTAKKNEIGIGYTDSIAVGRYYLNELQLEQEPGGKASGDSVFSDSNPLGRFSEVTLYSKY